MAKRMKNARYVASAMVMASCLVAAGVTANAGASGFKGTVKVLLVTNVSGSGSDNGVPNVAGAKVAINQINKAGGVLGKKVVLVVKDDASNYANDLPIVESATGSYNYPLVMNSDYGAPATAPYLTRHKILSITSSGVTGLANPKVNPYLFDDLPSTLADGEPGTTAAVDYGLSEGYTKWALIVDNTSNGAADVTAAEKAIPAGGGTITDTESISYSTVNLGPAIAKAQASGATAVLLNMFGASAGYFYTAAASANWNVPVFGSVATAASNLAAIATPAQLANTVVVGPAIMAGPPANTADRQFIANLIANQGTIKLNLFLYATTHDALTIWAYAANHSKSLVTATVAKYIASHGKTAIPNLTLATTTGYTPGNHEWNPVNGLAVMKPTAYVNGQMTRIKLLTAK